MIAVKTNKHPFFAYLNTHLPFSLNEHANAHMRKRRHISRIQRISPDLRACACEQEIIILDKCTKYLWTLFSTPAFYNIQSGRRKGLLCFENDHLTKTEKKRIPVCVIFVILMQISFFPFHFLLLSSTGIETRSFSKHKRIHTHKKKLFNREIDLFGTRQDNLKELLEKRSFRFNRHFLK